METKNFINNLKINNDILKLQKDYENGIITENEMTPFQIIELKKLYNQQIEDNKRCLLDKKYKIKKYLDILKKNNPPA